MSNGTADASEAGDRRGEGRGGEGDWGAGILGPKVDLKKENHVNYKSFSDHLGIRIDIGR